MAVPQNYDVFLNFRGPDSRTGFVDFLYSSLVAAGVHVFRDDDALPIGEDIGRELMSAIRNCRIAIPIISEKYAQSTWCLREITEIMNCYGEHDNSVFPVFYKVDVRDLIRGSGKFGEDLTKKEIARDEVLRWQKALRNVTNIRGWISQTIANGYEEKLVKIVVARVLSELKTTWIERLPMFPIVMSNHHMRSLYHYYMKEKRRLRQCQVFLAFRGCDTRYQFAQYLYVGLVTAKIRVFYDGDSSMVGKAITQELFNAIRHCNIFIPIISPNFASSLWCLDEVSYMLECKRKDQRILPIFYKVNPSDVRNLSSLFGDHFHKHEKHFSRSTCEIWKQALKKVGSLKGWESEKIANGRETVIVEQVVEEVSRLLKNILV